MDSKKRKKGSKDTKTTPKKVKSSDLPPQINIFNDDSFSTPSYITETQSIYEIHPTLIYPGNINESNMNYMPYSNQINNEEVKKTTKTSQSNKKSSSKAKTKRLRDKGKQSEQDLGLSDQQRHDLFDLIAEEHPDL